MSEASVYTLLFNFERMLNNIHMYLAPAMFGKFKNQAEFIHGVCRSTHAY